ncbi:MAG TPA: GntR family transcriptional regulator [Gemmatimonadaceae bacterium]|nr:GntR family transcriptional regulator [Gemmatimonadaceae bacterium]
MLITVDLHSGIPVYRQIIEQVRFHVASGLLAPGDELPSTRALSAELAVNPMTVSKAYGLLEKEGVVERRPGLPLVVRARRRRAVQRERVEQLRMALAPAVTAARQLGIDGDDATGIFREMLGGAAGSDRTGATAAPPGRRVS